jgi:hypothetical protein
LATKLKANVGAQPQQGAALVEFTMTFMVFLILILGIIEFSLVVYDASRLAEATRAATRFAIVNNPSCNIFGKESDDSDAGCTPENHPLDCSLVDPLDSDTIDSVTIEISSCPSTATPRGCQMVALMDQMMLRSNNSILADGIGRVRITYACSGVGDPQLFTAPVVTVAAENIQHPMMFAAIFGFYSPGGSGIGRTITLPKFETSRTAEDMYAK